MFSFCSQDRALILQTALTALQTVRMLGSPSLPSPSVCHCNLCGQINIKNVHGLQIRQIFLQMKVFIKKYLNVGTHLNIWFARSLSNQYISGPKILIIFLPTNILVTLYLIMLPYHTMQCSTLPLHQYTYIALHCNVQCTTLYSIKLLQRKTVKKLVVCLAGLSLYSRSCGATSIYKFCRWDTF